MQNTWFISIDTNHYCANTFAVGIDSGKVIEDTLDWSNSVSDIYFNTSPSMMCDMIQPTDFLYYPIKLINNVGDKYFGWIYFSCNDSIILKETAICLIPNQPIYTGHQGLYYGLQEYTTTPSTIILYPNPNDGKFTIHQNNYSPDQQLVIIDLLGNKVYSQALHNSIETIDISQLSGGIYFYEINGKRGKLVKQ